MAVAFLPARLVARVLKKALVAGAFAFVIFLPSALWGNWSMVLLVTEKVLIAVALVALLSATTGWPAISRGLAAFRVPDLFILVLDITIRYIGLLGGLALEMLRALKLRSVGRNDGKTASLASIAGTTFLRSKEAAEEMYQAMECRCFSGTYRSSRRPSDGHGDESVPGATPTVSGTEPPYVAPAACRRRPPVRHLAAVLVTANGRRLPIARHLPDILAAAVGLCAIVLFIYLEVRT